MTMHLFCFSTEFPVDYSATVDQKIRARILSYNKQSKIPNSNILVLRLLKKLGLLLQKSTISNRFMQMELSLFATPIYIYTYMTHI